VFAPQFAPLRIASFARRPPQNLQIHHGVDDAVIGAHAPRRNQTNARIEELL